MLGDSEITHRALQGVIVAQNFGALSFVSLQASDWQARAEGQQAPVWVQSPEAQ